MKKICKCGKLHSRKSKYCENCSKAIKLAYNRKYHRLNREKHRIINKKWRDTKRKNNLAICKICNELKPKESFGMCKNCYKKWSRVNKKLSKMNEQEKQEYLEKRGLIDKKIEPESFLEITKELDRIYDTVD